MIEIDKDDLIFVKVSDVKFNGNNVIEIFSKDKKYSIIAIGEEDVYFELNDSFNDVKYDMIGSEIQYIAIRTYDMNCWIGDYPDQDSDNLMCVMKITVKRNEITKRIKISICSSIILTIKFCQNMR